MFLILYIILGYQVTEKYKNIMTSEAEFKEFEQRFKYGWFHLKLYQMFQDLSRRVI